MNDLIPFASAHCLCALVMADHAPVGKAPRPNPNWLTGPG